jgi:hypothetical protein
MIDIIIEDANIHLLTLDHHPQVHQAHVLSKEGDQDLKDRLLQHQQLLHLHLVLPSQVILNIEIKNIIEKLEIGQVVESNHAKLCNKIVPFLFISLKGKKNK